MEEKNQLMINPYQPEPAPLWIWRVVIVSAVGTLGIFLLLPFSEILLKQYQKQLSLRRIDTAEISKPPPKQPPSVRREIKKEIPKPKLAKTRKQLTPLQIAASFGLDMGNMTGDFALGFGLTPTLADEDLVFELSEVDQPPYPIVQIPPVYPISAKVKRIEGKVELIFIVRADGSVDSSTIKIVSSKDIFVQAAINAVKQWRFKPGTKGGRAVATRVLLPLRFQLGGSR